jgi:hypothetical protein
MVAGGGQSLLKYSKRGTKERSEFSGIVYTHNTRFLVHFSFAPLLHFSLAPLLQAHSCSSLLATMNLNWTDSDDGDDDDALLGQYQGLGAIGDASTTSFNQTSRRVSYSPAAATRTPPRLWAPPSLTC